MALDSYANLKTTIADWLNRSDLTDAIPDFITLAESRIANEEDVSTERRETLTVSARNTALPADFRALRSLSHIGSTYFGSVDRVSPEELAAYDGLSAGATGVPRRCAITKNGDELLVAPTPDTTYALEIVYDTTLDALSATNTTNWVLAGFPGAYLYGALLAAAPYLKDDPRIATWQTLYDQAIADIQKMRRRQKHSGPLTIRRRRPIGG